LRPSNTPIRMPSKPLFFRLFMIHSQNLALRCPAGHLQNAREGVGRNLQTQNLALTVGRNAQSHVYGLVFDLSAFRITDFNPQGIEKNDWANRLQRAVLPV